MRVVPQGHRELCEMLFIAIYFDKLCFVCLKVYVVLNHISMKWILNIVLEKIIDHLCPGKSDQERSG